MSGRGRQGGGGGSYRVGGRGGSGGRGQRGGGGWFLACDSASDCVALTFDSFNFCSLL